MFAHISSNQLLKLKIHAAHALSDRGSYTIHHNRDWHARAMENKALSAHVAETLHLSVGFKLELGRCSIFPVVIFSWAVIVSCQSKQRKMNKL